MKAKSLLVLALICVASTADAATFTDGFEGSTLDPYWTLRGPGTPSFDTSLIHTGSQSLRLQTSTTFPWDINLIHQFDAGVTGSVSVWAQQSDLCCGTSVGLAIGVDALTYASIQQFDTSGFYARINVEGVLTDYLFPEVSGGWHQFSIEAGATGVSIKFDGTEVLSHPAITTLGRVEISEWGSPAGIGNVDDFVANTVPEPSTALLISGALSCGLWWRRRKRTR